MSQHKFSLSFCFQRGHWFKAKPSVIELTHDLNNAKIELLIPSKNPFVRKENKEREFDYGRYSLLGGPYDSYDEAGEAAERAKLAILLWAVSKGIGVDFGGRMASSGVRIEESEVYSLHLILEVFPKPDISPKRFATGFRKGFIENKSSLTSKQSLALELYAGSSFDISERSKFLTRISAVEVLMTQEKSAIGVLELLAELTKTAKGLKARTEDKEIALQALGRAKRESKIVAATNLVKQHLKRRKYEGMSAVEAFKKCYNVRSSIVHDGEPNVGEDDFKGLSRVCNSLVKDLLLASIAKRSAERI